MNLEKIVSYFQKSESWAFSG